MKGLRVYLVIIAVMSAVSGGIYVRFHQVEKIPAADGDSMMSENERGAGKDFSWEIPHPPLPAESENIHKLTSELRYPVTDDANLESKRDAARELNRAYFRTNSALVRDEISAVLSRALREEKNKTVARSISFSHSRLFFDKNTLPNLNYARSKNIISFDDYYGELSHLFPEAPPDIREKMVGDISGSYNRYAVDIISEMISSGEDLSLSSNEGRNLYQFLTANEPIFSGAINSFGYFDSLLYANWLVAVSRLRSMENGLPPEQLLAEKILDPATDPRASVAFLISPHAKRITASQRSLVRWDEIQFRAKKFVQENPHAQGLQAIAPDMEH